MIVELFSIPVFIGNIDASKIEIKNKQFKKTWLSDTESTHGNSTDGNNKKFENVQNVEYLMKTIVELLEEKIKYNFEIRLLHIWENFYNQHDYQEPHIHEKSDFSFIIYKDVEEGKTVFLNPIKNYLLFYKNIAHMFDSLFMPKCKTGQIIIFPSFLEHMVLKNSNQTTIAGNLKFIKK